ncbi:DUF445 family protein [Shouchella shacheensis]|uniref:DUF445 family protein n=1 Tax=Shouchella shacheensis TaxID=1649580 RepID=UPI00074018AE|nr:DUF445 family protein [Shouchella shacheensis]
MQGLALILFMAVVGAVVGAVTNALAIRMLFRPYRALYIGSWHLPFTPGLLPKRQKEIAVQLGNIVAKHLLTAEGLAKKLGSDLFRREMNSWLQTRVRDWLKSERTLQSYLGSNVQEVSARRQLIGKTKAVMKREVEGFLQENRNQPLKNVLPRQFQENVEASLSLATEKLLQKGRDYVASREGSQRIGKTVEHFLSKKGRLGSMVSMFFSKDKLVELLQPELLKLLDQENTRQTVESLLNQEWEKLLERELGSFDTVLDIDLLVDRLTALLDERVTMLNWIDAPLHTWTGPYEARIVQEWVPTFAATAGEYIQKHVAAFLEKLKLEDVIKEQVESFSMQHLEELIMAITKRELKMITFLGGVIGGLVGLIQALVVLSFY